MVADLPLNQVICGDAVELMQKLPDDSIHAIVTDPPYGLEFMGEEWDRFRPNAVSPRWSSGAGFSPPGIGERRTPWPSHYSTSFFGTANPTCAACGGRLRGSKRCTCEKPKWRVKGEPVEGGDLPAFQWFTTRYAVAYHEFTLAWAREAIRVLKPGASMLVMGGTRTYHRMACGVEDAGFEIKDTILWCYNSGFPKAQDLGKMIDEQYFEEQLKKMVPEYRQVKIRICSETPDKKAARKKWKAWRDERKKELGLTRGVVGKRTDGRYAYGFSDDAKKALGSNFKDKQGMSGEMGIITVPATDLAKEWDGWKVGGLKPAYEPIVWAVKPPEGSCVDNVLKHGVGAVNVDGCRIPYESGDDIHKKNPHTVHKAEANYGIYSPYADKEFEVSGRGRYPANMIRTDRFDDGYDRFYFVPKASRGERDKGLEGMPEREGAHANQSGRRYGGGDRENWKDPYKRPLVKNIHPTVKPAALMEHLIKLVTREGQIVLDPFVGSGTTCIAARRLLRDYIGIDNNPGYVEIAKHRLSAIPSGLEARS